MACKNYGATLCTNAFISNFLLGIKGPAEMIEALQP